MKYIDAEKLKAEIERRIKSTLNISHIPCHRREELEGLLSFVGSLQQEQPEVDLEEEIDKVWNNGLSDELAGPHNNFDICARLARHFYELGLNARKE